jgi:two-component system, sporulation sensor kinase E
VSVRTNPRFAQAHRIAGYLTAFVLPWLATLIARHMPALHNTPFALNFACVAAIATLFELGPSLTAVFCNVLYFNYYILDPAAGWSLGRGDIIRSGIILSVGLLIVFFGQRLRNTTLQYSATHAALQEETDALMLAQRGSKSAAWVYSTKTNRVAWHPGGADLFGCQLADVSAAGSPDRWIIEEDLAKVEAAELRTRRTGDTFLVEYRVTWPNGEIHWLEANGRPTPADPTTWRGVTRDITDRKKAELALIRSEKLAAAGRMAASIAHEINNPLASITNLVYLARLTANNDETKGYLDIAEKELARIAQIANQTLRFHKQQYAAEPTDLVEMFDSLLHFYDTRLQQAAIRVQFDARPTPPLSCLAGEVRQLLTNLIGNAIDAMPNGGTLRLRLRPSTHWLTQEPIVRITVADNGTGMSPETREHIFEPFFTTKPTVGTGLGLWVSSQIVEKHKGTLSAKSTNQLGRSGSVFTVALPHLPRPQRKSIPISAELISQTGGGAQTSNLV